MHHIPCFWFCCILGWKTSTKSLYIFELLTYLAQLIVQFILRKKAFKLAYLPNCFCRSTSNRVVKIEMELIYHMPAQIVWYVYFSIVADYSYFMNSLIEVTRSLIHDVCTEFGFFIYQIFLLFSFNIQEIYWKNICCFQPYQFRITLPHNTDSSL